MTKLPYEAPFLRKLNAGPLDKFGPAASPPAMPDIAGVAVADLLARFGSPLFVLDEKALRRSYQAAYRAFATRYPLVQLAWSYKTNYLNAVCRVFHQEGAWAEVVSGMELEKALGNGVPGSHILFNGPAKSRADLARAFAVDAVVHIDNADELFAILEMAPALARPPRVALRVNLDAGIFPQWDRFGFNLENGEVWRALERLATAGTVALTGLHCHIGTYIMQPAAYAAAATKLAALALRFARELRTPIAYLDLGGGFPSANVLKGAAGFAAEAPAGLDNYAEAITKAVLEAGFRPDELPLLVLEAGRALVDEAGFLLGTVMATKRLPDGRRATVVDFGVNLLFTAYWYDHAINPAKASAAPVEDTVLYGPLCMNIDVLRASVRLPVLAAGDAVVVQRVGAYNMSQWQQFITLRPKVVLIDATSTAHIIRAAETLDYLQQLEAVPAHLVND